MSKLKAVIILVAVAVTVGITANWAMKKEDNIPTSTGENIVDSNKNSSENNGENDEDNNGNSKNNLINESSQPSATAPQPSPSPSVNPTGEAGHTDHNEGEATSEPIETKKPGNDNTSEAIKEFGDSIEVVAEPENITALINPNNRLPDDYVPSDLVYPDTRFIFNEKIDKRKMRKEAAEALEDMFAAADKAKMYLAGVSGYRSHAYQTDLFNRYVKKDGLEKARTYSAYPGTSEHESGLAIDVTRSDGKCAANDCFGDMDEAKWVAEHAHEYGFIVRYPKGKEKVTGYQYEPWHIRYVGKSLATELYESGQTLEEYYNAIPVNR